MVSKSRFVFFVVMIVCLAMSALAQNKCTPSTIKGQYSVSCSGFAGALPDGPFLPYAGLGTIYTDANGYVRGPNDKVVMKIGGLPIADPLTHDPLPTGVEGQTVVNSDCTGTVNYRPYGTPSFVPAIMHVNFNILDQGKEIQGFLTDPGMTVQCTLKLMNREATTPPAE